MNRRDFISFVGAAMACPATAFAEDSREFIAFTGSLPSHSRSVPRGFREGLRARGYVEGKNVVLELHYAIGNPQALREVATNSGAARSTWRFERAGDARDDDGRGSAGPVCAERRPRGTGPGTRVSGSLAVTSPARPSCRSNWRARGLNCSRRPFPNSAQARILSNANHPGEQSEWRATRGPPRSSVSRGCMFPSPAPTNWTAHLGWWETRMRMRCWFSLTSDDGAPDQDC